MQITVTEDMMRTKWIAPVALLAAPAMALCQYLIYQYAPVEQAMGIVQKVFYTHLPLAWWSLFSFFCVFIASILYLKTRKRFWDNVAAASAEVGVLFSGFALVTGMIWGRHSWGVWWTWDPRLTTTLVMWFVYAGYLILRSMSLSTERKAVVSSVVGIAAFIDVPLVFLSARLWRSIHPAVFNSETGGLEPEMKITAIVCVICFGLIWATLVGIRSSQMALSDRIDNLTTHDEI